LNIILFTPAEVELPLPRDDARATHLLNTLRRKVGDMFDAGLINGPRGKGFLLAINDDALSLRFEWQSEPPALLPIHVLIGLPRPQTARDILRDATTLGVSALHFIRSEKGESSYASSSLWTQGEWRRHIVAGAAQAFCTRLPIVTQGETLAHALSALPTDSTRLALDNYEAAQPLGACQLAINSPIVVAIGSERGWSERERALFREHQFTLVHLGTRVLRTETATLAAITLLQSKLGLF
jgi:16S rRNA (uracil1498-N3)-methyltransferase